MAKMILLYDLSAAIILFNPKKINRLNHSIEYGIRFALPVRQSLAD